MHEPLPLSKIQGAVLEFLQGRDDAVLFGAQAVNAYVSEPRATQDVDILSTRAKELAEELREHLSEMFHIAVRVREVGDKGLRVDQVRKEGNRHLVDLRQIKSIPGIETHEQIRILSPVELIVSKIISFRSRFGQAKSWTDRRDLTVLLQRFPDLKVEAGEVEQLLQNKNVKPETLQFWYELVGQDLVVEGQDDDLNF